MKIHALQTGTATLKQSFLHARPGMLGTIRLFFPDQWAEPVPIHAWLIEHEGHRTLVDTGDIAAAQNFPFAKYAIDHELPEALAEIGLTVDDIDTAIVTHLHSDHHNGAIHINGPVLVAQSEWAEANSRRGRFAQRITKAPLAADVDWQTYALDDGPFGAFPASHHLTPDGRILAVATPGHTLGHVSVIAIDDDGRHVLIAGDVSDSLEQLLSLRADPVARDAVKLHKTMNQVLEHSRLHPTVYLPTHDRDSRARLDSGALLEG